MDGVFGICDGIFVFFWMAYLVFGMAYFFFLDGILVFLVGVFGIWDGILGFLEPVCDGCLAMSVVRNNIKVNVALPSTLEIKLTQRHEVSTQIATLSRNGEPFVSFLFSFRFL